MVLLKIEIPDTLKITESSWAPADVTATRQMGDEWLDSMDSAALRVPSVLVPNQNNYLLNPVHPLFDAVQVVDKAPFAFDSRVFSFPPNP
jgi:RES domain-containing protein